MIIYIFEGYKGKKHPDHQTDELVRKSLYLYIKEKVVPVTEKEAFYTKDSVAIKKEHSQKIVRNSGGKPCFKDLPYEFSISHTKDIWACIMGNQPVGLDIQVMRKARYENIADRYFMPHEAEYVRKNGPEGFMDLWVRKEAFLKYLGKGLAEGIKIIDTIEAGKPAKKTEAYGKKAYFTEIDIRKDVKCVCASAEKEEIWKKTIK